jgi:hypothetical protein
MQLKNFNDISNLVNMMTEYSLKNDSSEKERFFNRIISLSKEINTEFLQQKKSVKVFDLMMKKFKNGLTKSSLFHSKKLLSLTKPVSNDFPFNVNDVVFVTRSEHGWHDGNMKAKIIQKHMNTQGIWSYFAQVFDDEKNQYDPHYFVKINHTRDAYLGS